MHSQVNFDSYDHISAKNVHSILKQHMLADGFNFVLDLEKSQGGMLVESRTGEEYLDMYTFFASMPVGMNHPRIANPEFIEHLGKIALNKPSNSDIYTSTFASFVDTFFKIAVPDYFKYSFYIEGGALAVENALKAAIDWKVRKNLSKGLKENTGTRIIHFKEAFHGRSGYTMSLTNTDPKKVMYFPKFDWPRISNPKIYFPMSIHNMEDLLERERTAINEIKHTFNAYPNDIAAIIIEPIQGEGGDNHFRKEFLKKLKELAIENEALLIFDEVQTGVGITGTMWAHQQLEVKPDIMCFGKKMQVCGILAGERLDEVPDNVFHVASRINSTWGGNLTDMARAQRYLEIIAEENLITNAYEKGAYLLGKLNTIQDNFNTTVSNSRGRGLFAAFDLPETDFRNEFVKKAFENKLIILPCGEKSVRFRPQLNVTDEFIDRAFEIIEKTLKQMA